MLTTLLHQSVNDITFSGNRLIGVKSQGLVPGKSSGFQKVNNETVTNPILMTFKTHCIKGIRKYMLLT